MYVGGQDRAGTTTFAALSRQDLPDFFSANLGK